jgi:hypothetical protein
VTSASGYEKEGWYFGERSSARMWMIFEVEGRVRTVEADGADIVITRKELLVVEIYCR